MTAPLHNIEAEQALIGALLYDNALYEQLQGWFRADHLHDPLHQAIWRAAENAIARGGRADALTLRSEAASWPGMADVGGPVYLATLQAEAPHASAADSYARTLVDLWARRAVVAHAAAIRHAAETGGEMNASELLDYVGAELDAVTGQGIGEARQGARVLDLDRAINGAFADMEQSIRGEFLTPTGLTDLDRVIGGYAPGELIIPAGRPGQGKTLLSGALCALAAKRGQSSVFVAIEMRAERMGARWLAAESGVSYSLMRQGRLEERQLRAVHEARHRMAAWPGRITTIDMPGASAPRLTAYLRRVKRDMARAGTPLRFVVIDYLQKLKAHTNRGSSKVAEVADISNALKDMARELDIAVVCPCQLNREVEGREGADKLPRLADLKWSGEIEQDADMVIGIHREAYYAEREPENECPVKEHDRLHRASMKTMDLVVLKNREGEAGRTIKLFCDPATGRISDLDARDEYGR